MYTFYRNIQTNNAGSIFWFFTLTENYYSCTAIF
jgi:hypothetical protein